LDRLDWPEAADAIEHPDVVSLFNITASRRVTRHSRNISDASYAFLSRSYRSVVYQILNYLRNIGKILHIYGHCCLGCGRV
jgi:hypothetical protein